MYDRIMVRIFRRQPLENKKIRREIKMVKAKKFTAMFMVCIMCVLALASCKSSSTDSFTEGDEFTPSKNLGVTVWYTQGTNYEPGEKLAKNIPYEWLKERTLVSIDNIYGNDGGQWDTKLSRLIMGDSMPEVVACGSGQGVSHFTTLAEQKQIWEIDVDTLKKYAPNVYERIPKDMLEKFMRNGKLIGLPYTLPTNETTQPTTDKETIDYINNNVANITSDETMRVWVRDDILKMIYPEAKSWSEIEKLHEQNPGPLGDEMFDVPINTTQDYIDFMYKIKSLNLKENGKSVFAFGYSGGDNWEALAYLGADMMGYTTHYYPASWNPIEQKMRVPLVEETVKQAAKYQNQMVRDNVIDPESLVHSAAVFKEKVMNGLYAVCVLSYAGNENDINNSLKAAGKSFRYRPLAVNVPNLDEYAAGKASNLWEGAITFTKKLDKEGLIQMLNWMNECFSDEFYDVYFWGRPEDGLYETDGNGVRHFKDERFVKYYDGDSEALSPAERMGLDCGTGPVGVWYTPACVYSEWYPTIYSKTYKMNTATAVTRFKSDSTHTNLPEYPPYNIWVPDFASIDDVNTFWAKREQWENPFKLALAATSEDEFESRWQSAIDNVDSIVDIDKMCDEMTAIAKNNLK